MTDQARQLSDLQTVLAVSRQLAVTTDLPTLLSETTAAALKVLDCERATVFLHDPSNDTLYSRVATGSGEIRFPAGAGIAGHAFKSAQVINIPDAYADPRFNPAIDKQTGFRTRNMLTFPLLSIDGSAIGVLQVLNKKEGTFTAWDEELVRTFGAQIGVAVQRQFLLDEFAKKQKFEHDLAVAEEIQTGIYPDVPPTFAGYEIAGWNDPADETGGDFFDYLVLPTGQLAVSIADATGHGIGAALVAVEGRAVLRAALKLTQNIAQVMTVVNQQLEEDLPEDRFVTMFFGLIDPANHTLHYSAAGHGPNLFLHHGPDQVEELNVEAPPLAIVDDIEFIGADAVTFAVNDVLLLITDGFLEWANAAGDEFGVDRLVQSIKQHRSEPAAQIIQSVRQDVLTFAAGNKHHDDLTAVVIKRIE